MKILCCLTLKIPLFNLNIVYSHCDNIYYNQWYETEFFYMEQWKLTKIHLSISTYVKTLAMEDTFPYCFLQQNFFQVWNIIFLKIILFTKKCIYFDITLHLNHMIKMVIIYDDIIQLKNIIIINNKIIKNNNNIL